jgi:hypothetical protein
VPPAGTGSLTQAIKAGMHIPAFIFGHRPLTIGKTIYFFAPLYY